MAKFAVIENNIVVNVIIADSLEMAEAATEKQCVEYTDENPAVIGKGWDGTTFEQADIVFVPAPLEDE